RSAARGGRADGGGGHALCQRGGVDADSARRACGASARGRGATSGGSRGAEGDRNVSSEAGRRGAAKDRAATFRARQPGACARAAPPPAPAPPAAPAPPKPAEATPAVDETRVAHEAALAVLRKYTSALERRDINALKAVWPSLGGREESAIETDFQNARSITVT